MRKLLARMNPQLIFGSDTNFVVREERAPGMPVVHLFRQGRAIPTILLWIGFFMSLIDIYLLTSWLPTVFHNAGITLSLSVIATAVFQGGGVVASLALGSFVDRFGSYRVRDDHLFSGRCLRRPARLLPFHRCHHGLHFFCRRGHCRWANRSERAGRFVLPDLHSLDRSGMGAGNWAHRIDCRPDLSAASCSRCICRSPLFSWQRRFPLL